MSFEAFYNIAANFLEDDDDEAMQNELKEAFRLYDKEGIVYNFINFTNQSTNINLS